MNKEPRKNIYALITVANDGSISLEVFATFEELRAEFFKSLGEMVEEPNATPEELVEMSEQFESIAESGVLMDAQRISVKNLKMKHYTMQDLLNREE